MSMKFATVSISTYYGDTPDKAMVEEFFTTKKEAEESLADSYPLMLGNNEAGRTYQVCEILEEDACYQTWLDGREWDGCPIEEPENDEEHGANASWAEQKSIDEGGLLPVAHYNKHGLFLVELRN